LSCDGLVHQLGFFADRALEAFSETRSVIAVRGGNTTTILAAVVTETQTAKKVKKESRKNDEGLSTNVFKPKEPYIGRCLLNTKIVGDDAPGETWHMVFTTEGLSRLEILLCHCVHHKFLLMSPCFISAAQS
jgi:hypothetical protein